MFLPPLAADPGGSFFPAKGCATDQLRGALARARIRLTDAPVCEGPQDAALRPETGARISHTRVGGYRQDIDAQLSPFGVGRRGVAEWASTPYPIGVDRLNNGRSQRYFAAVMN
jgi:hypothetical protein